MRHISNGILFDVDDGSGDGGGTGDDGSGDGDDDDDNDDDDDADQLTPEEIKDLRAENERLKKREGKRRTDAAREAKAKKDAERKRAKEEGNTSELQKQLDDERAAREDAETRLQRSQAISIAEKLGAVEPGDVIRLLDWDELVDPTDPDEIKQAVRSLLKDKPHMRRQTKDSDGGSGGSGGNDGMTMTDRIRAAAGRSR